MDSLMSLFKKGLIIALLPCFAFTAAHKFYVSVTQVTYSSEEETLQITSRVFIDDLEQVLKERFGADLHLATSGEEEIAASHIEKYLHTKFVLYINGKETAYSYLGKRYDNDIMVCYMEVSGIPPGSISSLEIQNDLLTDLFEEQKNIVHITINDLKKSFVLVRENNKAMLNL
jgi:hypothetical protein